MILNHKGIKTTPRKKAKEIIKGILGFLITSDSELIESLDGMTDKQIEKTVIQLTNIINSIEKRYL